MQDVAKIVDYKGIEGWFDLKEDLLEYNLDGYKKVTDTIDVWFDSGSTHETTKSLLDSKNLMIYISKAQTNTEVGFNPV